MKLLLQSDWQADYMTAPVRQAVQQIEWKGGEVWTSNVSLHEINTELPGNDFLLAMWKNYTQIGTVEFVKAFADKVGVKLPDPIHATELLELEGRDWYINTREQLNHWSHDGSTSYPVFVKPYTQLKKFTGFVAKLDKDFDLYPEVDWSTTELFVTEVLENIVSEWRCYVLNGKVFACVNYSGDPLRFPFKHVIEELTEKVSAPPIAYSLDVAVIELEYENNLTGQYFTHFIEVNDAFALGYYGGDVELYTKMLNERWKEIIKNQ